MNRAGTKRTVVDDSADVIDAALRDSDVIREVTDIIERIARDDSRAVDAANLVLTDEENEELRVALSKWVLSHPTDVPKILCAVLFAYARNVVVARLSS